jgi:hypothetical protein
MTVIAWDGTVLAADKLFVFNGLKRTGTKLERVGDLLVAATGMAWAAREAIEWVRRGRKPEDYPACQRDKDDWAALVVIEDRRCLLYERSPYPTKLEDRIFAAGNGRDFALAAMYLGQTAIQAVDVACVFCPDCGNGVDWILAP